MTSKNRAVAVAAVSLLLFAIGMAAGGRAALLVVPAWLLVWLALAIWIGPRGFVIKWLGSFIGSLVIIVLIGGVIATVAPTKRGDELHKARTRAKSTSPIPSETSAVESTLARIPEHNGTCWRVLARANERGLARVKDDRIPEAREGFGQRDLSTMDACLDLLQSARGRWLQLPDSNVVAVAQIAIEAFGTTPKSEPEPKDARRELAEYLKSKVKGSACKRFCMLAALTESGMDKREYRECRKMSSPRQKPRPPPEFCETELDDVANQLVAEWLTSKEMIDTVVR